MQRPTRRLCWPAYRKFLQSTDWPILVGPWRSELGFEALYWIPFVQALGIAPDRLIPVTRGGAAAFYGSPHGVELFALRTPKEVRIENILQLQRTKVLKQTFVTPWDRQVIKDAAKAAGLTRYHVLHPAWMYNLLAPYWEGTDGLERAYNRLMLPQQTAQGSQLTLRPIHPPSIEIDGFPQGFVAMRFYARSTFPYNELSLTCARESIKQIAKHAPVVLLNAGVHADEHTDFDIKGVPNVYRLKDVLPVTPENNLALQAAVIGKAQGFVGTYGGLSQLAMRIGKPTISFYQQWQGTALGHKHLADALATALNIPCLVLRVQDVPLLRSVLPALQLAQSSSGVSHKPFVPRPEPVEQTA